MEGHLEVRRADRLASSKINNFGYLVHVKRFRQFRCSELVRTLKFGATNSGGLEPRRKRENKNSGRARPQERIEIRGEIIENGRQIAAGD